MNSPFMLGEELQEPPGLVSGEPRLVALIRAPVVALKDTMRVVLVEKATMTRPWL